MALNTQQLVIPHQLFSSLDETQKTEFCAWIAEQDASFNEDSRNLTVTTIEEFLSKQHTLSKCPFCGSSHIVKNGYRNGHQRFICKDCHKTKNDYIAVYSRAIEECPLAMDT